MWIQVYFCLAACLRHLESVNVRVCACVSRAPCELLGPIYSRVPQGKAAAQWKVNPKVHLSTLIPKKKKSQSHDCSCLCCVISYSHRQDSFRPIVQLCKGYCFSGNIVLANRMKGGLSKPSSGKRCASNYLCINHPTPLHPTDTATISLCGNQQCMCAVHAGN